MRSKNSSASFSFALSLVSILIMLDSALEEWQKLGLMSVRRVSILIMLDSALEVTLTIPNVEAPDLFQS